MFKKLVDLKNLLKDTWKHKKYLELRNELRDLKDIDEDDRTTIEQERIIELEKQILDLEPQKTEYPVYIKVKCKNQRFMKVVLNGKETEFQTKTVSYKKLVEAVGLDPKGVYSVMYKKSKGEGGTLVSNERVVISENMVFNVTDASNA